MRALRIVCQRCGRKLKLRGSGEPWRTFPTHIHPQHGERCAASDKIFRVDASLTWSLQGCKSKS